METEGRYTFIGAVVLAVLAALIGAGVWLQGGADRNGYHRYTILFTQQTMDGVAIGSAVKMRGINVGGVDRFHFDGDERIRVVIRVDAEVPVRVGAKAYVKRNFVTGLASIEIENGGATSPRLTRAPPGERYPVIAEGGSDIERVATTVTRLADTGTVVLERMNEVLSDENRAALSGTLANLNAISGHLADSRQSLDAVLQGIRDASDEFRFAGASITQAATRAEDSLASLGQRADIALRETTLMMVGLQQESALISQQIQALTESGSLELVQTSRDVRAGADALVAAGQKLANPRALIFAPAPAELGPGESTP